MPPIKPMSWYGGSQKTELHSAVHSKALRISSRLCSKLPWLSITPLGIDVEPEVYCKKARLSLEIAGGVQSASKLSGTFSVFSQQRSRNSGAWVKRCSRLSRTAEEASATLTFASPTMPCKRGMGRLGLGGNAGMAVTPAYRQPKKAVMYSRPGG